MDFVELRSFDNYIEANIVLNMLQHQNIVCHLKDENIITIDPFLSPAIGGMKLMEDAEEEYLKTKACPVCHSHRLTIQSVQKKSTCRLASLASMILGGNSVEVSKFYRCENCGYDFKELPG